MKIRYIHGDLLQAPEAFIVQGCNAQGVMGSGVAKLIRDRDENVYTQYRRVYEEQGNQLELGQVIWVKSKTHIFVNAITQEFFGRVPGTIYVSYDGLRRAMSHIDFTLAAQIDENPIPAVAMPLIGAGLAQGKWSIISQIIEEESKHFQPIVYLIDGVIPDGVAGEVSSL